MALVATEYRLTGRLRDQRHEAVEGFTILAFARTPRVLMRPDASLGTSRTGADGCFEMVFSSAAFERWFEKEPDVYLELIDREGNPILTTSSKKNDTGRIDFQIELRDDPGQRPRPPVSFFYPDGVGRMIEDLKAAGDFADVSRDDVNVVLNLLLRTLESYALFTDQLLTLSGYDGIQVPEDPRGEDHHHVTRWDEAVSP